MRVEGDIQILLGKLPYLTNIDNGMVYDAMWAGAKGFEIGVDYVFVKNIMGTLKCFVGKEMQDEYDNDDPMQSTAYTLFGELNFFF